VRNSRGIFLERGNLLFIEERQSELFEIRILFEGGIVREKEPGTSGGLTKVLQKKFERKWASKLEEFGSRCYFDFDYDFIEVELILLKEGWKEALRVLKALFMEEIGEEEIEDAKVELEKEKREEEEDPFYLPLLKLSSCIFGNHPYSRDPYGFEFTLEDVREYKKELLKNSQILLGAFSGIEGEIFFDEIRESLPFLLGRKTKQNSCKPILKKGIDKISFEWSSREAGILFGGIMGNEDDRLKVAADVAFAILTGGSFAGGRLWRNLRRTGLSYSLHGFKQTRKISDLYSFSVLFDRSQKELVEEKVVEEIKRLRDGIFTEEEIKEAKKILELMNLLSIESPSSRLENILKSKLLSKPSPLRYLELLDSLNNSLVKEASKILFSSYSMMILNPSIH